MASIRPFQGLRPAEGFAASIAALPYDVYSRSEAKEVVRANPLSFLKIDRPETQFPDDTDMYSREVYEKAHSLLEEMKADGFFIKEETDCYYLYALTMNGRTQTGIVGCASIDDYENGLIRKHENTRADKEQDRICHVDTLSAQTGPIFLAYRTSDDLNAIIRSEKKLPSLYDFTSSDGVRHQVWRLDSPDTIAQISHIFSEISHIYIADGHHRAASAVKVGLKRRAEHPDYNGSEEFNYFLSVLFPENELHIYDYNRVVTGFNGHTLEELFAEISRNFKIKEIKSPTSDDHQKVVWRPSHKGEFGMYIDRKWYVLEAKSFLYSQNPVDDLDVSILQNMILEPLFGIHDPKTDSRIQFVGGIRGLEELVRLTDTAPQKAAFAMYPTSMHELLRVADAGLLMPPKSTWFEPKLRSGLFIHEFER